MSFKAIEHPKHGPLATGVSIGASITGNRSAVRIRFGVDILNAMKWAPGCYLGLARGDGRDAGKLRIGLNELNGYKLLKGAPRDRSKFLFCGRLSDGKKHPSKFAPHQIRNGYLYIDLPDWARPAE